MPIEREPTIPSRRKIAELHLFQGRDEADVRQRLIGHWAAESVAQEHGLPLEDAKMALGGGLRALEQQRLDAMHEGLKSRAFLLFHDKDAVPKADVTPAG